MRVELPSCGSHAPSDGRHAGGAVESVAFNPSVPPLQAALVALLDALSREQAEAGDVCPPAAAQPGGEHALDLFGAVRERVVAAVLVEVGDAAAAARAPSWAARTRALLEQIAPDLEVPLYVVTGLATDDGDRDAKRQRAD